MILPIERLSTASIGTAETGNLLLTVDRDRALLWIREVEDQRYAVFLTGERAGQAEEIRPDAAGSGLAIAAVQVRVDAASVSSECHAWSLRARDGSLSMAFETHRHGRSPEHLWSNIATFETDAEAAYYFTRWEIGLVVEDQWIALVTVHEGEVTSALGQPGDLAQQGTG